LIDCELRFTVRLHSLRLISLKMRHEQHERGRPDLRG
jgi:hypothetical protein